MIDDIVPGDSGEGIETFVSNSFRSVVYPNPSDDQVEIDFSNPGHPERVIEIYNLPGRRVYKSTVDNGIIKLTKNDAGGEGSYIYKIEQGQHSFGKFIFK